MPSWVATLILEGYRSTEPLNILIDQLYKLYIVPVVYFSKYIQNVMYFNILYIQIFNCIGWMVLLLIPWHIFCLKTQFPPKVDTATFQEEYCTITFFYRF